MSWFATKYAWRCSHVVDDVELIKGSTKLLLLAMAYRVPQGFAKTEPTSLQQFQALTGIQVRQLRNCRDVLQQLGEIDVETGGHQAVYTLPKMIGPLFATQNPAKIAGFDGGARGGKAVKIAGLASAKIAAESGKDCRPNAGGVLSLDLSTNNNLRTTTTTTTTTDEAAVVEAFLDWFLGEYPKHRHGALYRVDPAAAEITVRELLAERSVERLQAMAREMWAETRDAWILQSDYSLHVLKHRASLLEGRVALAETRAALYPAPFVRDTPSQVFARLLARLDEQTDGPIGVACRHVAAQLRAGALDMVVLHAELLTAAAQVFDVEVCEADARAEMAEFRHRMKAATYDEALRTSIARHLLRRANLPNLLDLQLPLSKEALG